MIYEHRIYTVIPGRDEALVGRFTEWFPVMEKYGAKICGGIYYTVVGDSNELSYILGFEDLAHLQQVYEDMGKDEAMLSMSAKWANEEPCTLNTRNKILGSTEYSPSDSSS